MAVQRVVGGTRSVGAQRRLTGSNRLHRLKTDRLDFEPDEGEMVGWLSLQVRALEGVGELHPIYQPTNLCVCISPGSSVIQ